jgi:hypothetical protein
MLHARCFTGFFEKAQDRAPAKRIVESATGKVSIKKALTLRAALSGEHRIPYLAWSTPVFFVSPPMVATAC